MSCIVSRRVVFAALYVCIAAPAGAAPVCRSFDRAGGSNVPATSAQPDGAVWYADVGGNRIVRVAPDGRQTPFVPTDGATSGLSGLALGSDGNLWYSKAASNRVGRIPTAGGQGVEFAPPEDNSFPSGLLADPRGQLWFYSPVRRYVGRVATDGSVAVIRMPEGDRDFRPDGMAADGAGRLWFTDRAANAIRRYDPASDQFARFDVATPRAHPSTIVAAPNGDLWFTMTAVDAVGRITAQGAITEFPLGPHPEGGRPNGIVVTADGTVWITTSGRNVVRIDRDGRLDRFRCAEGLGTAVIGPEGTPWFLGNGRMWYVADARTPQTPRPTAAAPVTGGAADGAATPWPRAGAPTGGAAEGGPSPVERITSTELLERLPQTRGRLIVQFTSFDPNCPFCTAANPRFDAIAARRARDATFWRVTYEPWSAISKDPNYIATGLGGLPAIVVFEDGAEIARVTGHHGDEATLENALFIGAP